MNLSCFKISAPSAPLDVSAMSPVFSIILLTWTAPASPNGIIRDYQITIFPIADISDVTTVSTRGSTLEFSITGLTAFTNYSISILAITVAHGESSDSIIVRTNEGSELL